MKLELNGKSYNIPEMDFNMICEIELRGGSLMNIESQPFPTIRAIIASIIGTDVQTAGKELGEHVMNGGDMGEVMSTISKALENSGFFQALADPKK